jgi:hypothetical protein
VRDDETLTSGPPNPVEKIQYRLSAPDRMAYTVNTGGGVVVIGASAWAFTPGEGWQHSSYGSGKFATGNWYDWKQYDQSIQLLGEHDVDGQRVAEVALMSPTLPVWFQLSVDVSSGRVSRVGMVAGGHFMVDSYSAYGVPQRIAAPGH